MLYVLRHVAGGRAEQAGFLAPILRALCCLLELETCNDWLAVSVRHDVTNKHPANKKRFEV